MWGVVVVAVSGSSQKFLYLGRPKVVGVGGKRDLFHFQIPNGKR